MGWKLDVFTSLRVEYLVFEDEGYDMVHCANHMFISEFVFILLISEINSAANW